MKHLLLLLASCIYFVGNSQDLIEAHPSIERILSVEEKQEFTKEYNRCKEILDENLDEDNLSEEDQYILGVYGTLAGEFELESAYLMASMDIGCSWYCGGGPTKVTASSQLKSQGKNNYEPENAHDLDLATAWVEGKKGDGIGEYLLYHFTQGSPRITQIKVANGYVKSEKAWRNNSRIKKLKLSIDEKPYAILNLEDKRAIQVFDFDPIGHPKRNEQGGASNWTMKFEIMEIYPGDKYDDMVISEIFFNGIDVHCFAAGTEITMADKTIRQIENLEIGDELLSYNRITKQYDSATILELASPTHCDLIEIEFSNNKKITCTKDHPFLSSNGEWKAFDFQKTKQDYNFDQVQQLNVGNKLLGINSSNNLIIKSIKEIHSPIKTYTVVKLSNNNTFIANGIVVGTEELRNEN